MSKSKTVPYIWCEPCGKRGFENDHDATKALGRARTRRNRAAAKAGAPTRRGIKRENRIYMCELGLLHLTEQSRRSFSSSAWAWRDAA
ncbi:hypothetical protein JNUCC0626_40340 [Lentzea sp. JNUCC 0626]|uniref:hypothetical protein n=1 Tax=Lentzea sp. JNUCC 0626 TaxID=3367513 RepID=UPI00374A583F